MARRYTITVQVEATFERSINARAARKEIERRVNTALRAGSSAWAVTGSSIKQKRLPSEGEALRAQEQAQARSQAREQARIERVAASQTQRAFDIQRAGQMRSVIDRAQVIVAQIRRGNGHVPKPTIRWDGCSAPNWQGRTIAHAHYGPVARILANGKWKRTENLICLRPARLEYFLSCDDEALMLHVAHELAHLGGHTHRMGSFKRRMSRFITAWHAAAGSTPTVNPDTSAQTASETTDDNDTAPDNATPSTTTEVA